MLSWVMLIAVALVLLLVGSLRWAVGWFSCSPRKPHRRLYLGCALHDTQALTDRKYGDRFYVRRACGHPEARSHRYAVISPFGHRYQCYRLLQRAGARCARCMPRDRFLLVDKMARTQARPLELRSRQPANTRVCAPSNPLPNVTADVLASSRGKAGGGPRCSGRGAAGPSTAHCPPGSSRERIMANAWHVHVHTFRSSSSPQPSTTLAAPPLRSTHRMLLARLTHRRPSSSIPSAPS